MPAEAYDVIVIGLGGMGSAALYQLARRGLKVLGIERFDIGHEYGSSHGLTRIIRLAYYEHPSYVPLMRRAYELWTQIEAETGEKLYYQTGSIDAGPEDSSVFAGSLQSCVQHGLDHEVLTAAQLSERFPGYRFPGETLAVFQPQGGLLVPERCIAAHIRAAQAHGAVVRTQEQVLDWHPYGERVRVTTERGRYEAGRLVITAGSWAGKLIPLLQSVAVPERQALIWLEVLKPEWFALERFPVFNCTVPEGRFYGFPEFNPSGTTPGFKYGRWHHLEEIVDPDDMVRLDVGPRDEILLRSFAERYFPQAAGRTLAMKACLFT
ncbi:MAG: N-methyl-L-tryptophan oxidase, partial [Anaerolineae bacterium]|nr:N-methyl-L-tryptophan oxidase [Anaerolineae bacterium]